MNKNYIKIQKIQNTQTNRTNMHFDRFFFSFVRDHQQEQQRTFPQIEHWARLNGCSLQRDGFTC